MSAPLSSRLLWAGLGLSAILSNAAMLQEVVGAEKPAASRWALLIGIDNYIELGKLRFAGSDQRALARQLVDSGFPQDQVFLLDDQAAEPKYIPFRENIEKQIELVLGLANPGDLLIVGFSGHGVQLEGKSYFCPIDTRLDKLSTTMIPLDSVYDRLAKCRATLKLLTVDACRNDLLPAGRRSVTLSRRLGEFADAREKPPEGILLLASCGPGQVSMEDEAFGHGVFMYYLLDGLRGKAANASGTVSLAGLYDYASLETKKYVARKFNEYQTPALRGEISGPFEIVTATPREDVPGAGTGKRKPMSDSNVVTTSIGMKMVLIPAGEFMMGSHEPAAGLVAEFKRYHRRFNASLVQGEYPHHRVRITKPFYLGMHEVTVGQFRRFVEDLGYATEAEQSGEGGLGHGSDGQFDQKPEFTWRNPGFPQTDEHPVVNVSWNDAVAFCEWLSRKERKTFRLPTEAEWEYACRAGKQTRFQHGDDPEQLPEVGNLADASAKEKSSLWTWTISASDGHAFTAPVGRFQRNPLGLYDMHGNVVEWCADWYGKDFYGRSPADDPKGPDSGSSRVLRGGSWYDGPINGRSAFRLGNSPDLRCSFIGFRAAMTP